MKRSTATLTGQFEFPFVQESELGAPHLSTRRLCVGQPPLQSDYERVSPIQCFGDKPDGPNRYKPKWMRAK
jgi:hypothetical protein